jgi:glutaminyl-tRNA synthetase
MKNTATFIRQYIQNDLEDFTKLRTRFPPEPNGYLHIGHAKSICLNFELAKFYGGKAHLRFDDTNPAKEDAEYVASIMEDIRWLGYDWGDDLYFASDYFETMYNCAITLIKKNLAFVCELTPEEIKEYRGTFNKPGVESPYRGRSIEENLDLFRRMRAGEFPDGSKTLRAKIDMQSPNLNLRDPVLYRVSRLWHHNTKDKWLIYPMYDYAHPIEDAIEKITHSICTMEFEDHRPLYDWVVDNVDLPAKPRQIEFAKLSVSNTILGKRFIKKLIDDGEVDGWNDPRLFTISGLRRRGYRPEAIRMFCDLIGVSKANNRVDIAELEYCAREDLKENSIPVMAVLDPLKVEIINYDGEEILDIDGRSVPFSKEIYIDKKDFMENPPKKYFRLFPGNEVRLKGAYFIKCLGAEKNADGETVLKCEYDPETKSGSGSARKVKGTIHWVNAPTAVKVTARVFDYLLTGDETGEYKINPASVTVYENCMAEPFLKNAKPDDRFQFIRDGFYCLDSKLSSENNLVFNQIVGLKSSYKPQLV